MKIEDWSNFKTKSGDTSMTNSNSFVDMRDVVAANSQFVEALAARKVNKKSDRWARGDLKRKPKIRRNCRYVSDLFYMAPIYHQAFTKLEKLLVIDSTDLTIVSDIKVSLLVNILTEEKSFLSGSVGPVWGDGGERPDVDGQRSVSTLQGKAVNFHQYPWFNWDTFWFKIACRPSWLIIEVDTLGQKLENQAGWSEVEKGDVCSQLWCTGCKDWTLAWCCTDWKEWGRVSFIPPIFIQRQCLTWWKGCWVDCVEKWKIFQGTTWRCPWLNRIGSLL